MTSKNKDSPEVIEFMALFAKVKDYCDDDPSALIDLAKDDPPIEKTCMNLFLASAMLSMNERRRRELFAVPVDPEFLSSWRDYESRYASAVADAFLGLAGLEIGRENSPPLMSKADHYWQNADDEAKEQAEAIEDAINFSDEQASDDTRGFPSGFAEQIADGFSAWQRLKTDAGFDLRGVFRRRAAIPFVLIPRHVAAREGDGRSLSMLSNLQQAHNAFIFGAPHAALAMMRSILETTLRDHYRASSGSLSQRINAAAGLPRGANKAALLRLKRLANAILHLDREEKDELPKLSPEKLEKEILSLLLVLRALIEGAPRDGRRAGFGRASQFE